MEQADHTIVQTAQALETARELSLTSRPESADGAPELPGYVLQRRLGRGSFGEVWAATQSGSGQSVAVKIFSQPKGLDFRYLQHEIKRLRQVAEHPHVVTLLDADFHHEPPFFVMGLYQQSLAAWRQETSVVELDLAVGWFEQIAKALKFTHDKGLLHCDLKPANVLLDAEQRVKVADFGQAVERGIPGSAVGSLGYMAPEQASLEDSSPDVRWDIYGMGATIYYLLGGRPPRLSDESRETMGSITDPTERLQRYREVIAASPLIPLKQLCPQIDPDLDDLIASCLNLDPNGRPESVADVLEDLARRKDSRPLLCRQPWSPWYRARRYARRNALSLSLSAVVLASLVAASSEYYQRAEDQRQAMALQQFDLGWQVAKEGRTTEAALWWRKALDTDPLVLPAQAALDSVSLKLVRELVHGDEAVTTVAASPDGQWLASADAKGELVLWKDGQRVASISGLKEAPGDAYTAAPDQFAFTPDGKHLLTTAGLFPIGSQQPSLKFEGDVAVDLHGAGALISHSGQSQFFDARTQKTVLLKEPPRPMASIGVGATGSLAVLGTDGKVDLYVEGKKVATGLHDKVGALAFSPDGTLLVTCSDDRTAKIFSAHTGQELKTLDHGWRVTSARFDQDGQHVVTTSYNGEVRIWDVTSGLAVMHHPMRHSWFAYGTVKHSQQELFASYGVDGRARVWQSNGVPLSPWYQHGAAIRDLDFIEVSNQLVTSGQDGKIRLWEVGEERKGIGTLDLGAGHELGTVALDPKQELFVLGWTTFPKGGGALLANHRGQRWPLETAGAAATKVTFASNGETIAVASADGKARLFNRQAKLLREVSHPASTVGLGLTPDGKTLMSASADGTIKLTGAMTKTLSVGAQTSDVKLSDDGRLVGAVSIDGKAIVLDIVSGQTVFSADYPTNLRRIIFDHQSSKALLCGQDGVARLVDLKTKRELHFEHDLMVTHAAFDSQGSKVVTVSLDGAVKVWDTVTGQQLPSPAGHDGPVVVVHFSPDDSLILTVSKDSRSQLWQTSTGLPFGLPIRHARIAYDGAFSTDGKMVVSCGHDGVAKFCSVPLQEGAVIPTASELEATVGSRLSSRAGKTVCESVPSQPQSDGAEQKS